MVKLVENGKEVYVKQCKLDVIGGYAEKFFILENLKLI